MQSSVIRMEYQKIAKQLNNMAEKDQNMRAECREKGMTEECMKKIQNIAREHTKKVKEIINQIEWPTISKVGKEASTNAWLLTQHADDVRFQKKALNLMKKEPKDEVEQKLIAYLEDRVRVNSGDRQLYGTQFTKTEDGEVKPLPIEDKENVDVRRKKMGFNSLDEYIKEIKNKQ